MDQLSLITPPNVALVISHLHAGDPGIAAVSREVNVKWRKHKRAFQILRAEVIEKCFFQCADIQGYRHKSPQKINVRSAVYGVDVIMEFL